MKNAKTLIKLDYCVNNFCKIFRQLAENSLKIQAKEFMDDEDNAKELISATFAQLAVSKTNKSQILLHLLSWKD